MDLQEYNMVILYSWSIEILQNVSCKMLLEPSLHSAVWNDYIVYIVLKLTIYTILEDVGLYN